MAQQISVEDAFPVFRERCRELFDENLILRAQVAVLERRTEELEQENGLLKRETEEPQPDADPSQPFTA